MLKNFSVKFKQKTKNQHEKFHLNKKYQNGIKDILKKNKKDICNFELLGNHFTIKTNSFKITIIII